MTIQNTHHLIGHGASKAFNFVYGKFIVVQHPVAIINKAPLRIHDIPANNLVMSETQQF